MFGWMVFGEMIRKVGKSTVPVNVEVWLLRLIPEPMVSHIPGLGPFLCDIAMDKTRGSGIVCFKLSRRLSMTKLFEHIANWNCHLRIVKDACCLPPGEGFYTQLKVLHWWCAVGSWAQNKPQSDFWLWGLRDKQHQSRWKQSCRLHSNEQCYTGERQRSQVSDDISAWYAQ